MCSLAEGQFYQIRETVDILKYKFITKFVCIIIPYTVGILILYSKSLPITIVTYMVIQLQMLQEHGRNIDMNSEKMSQEKDRDLDECREIFLKRFVMKHQEIIK